MLYNIFAVATAVELNGSLKWFHEQTTVEAIAYANDTAVAAAVGFAGSSAFAFKRASTGTGAAATIAAAVRLKDLQDSGFLDVWFERFLLPIP